MIIMNIFLLTLLPITITLVIVAIAAYYDFKKGIIPNKLTFTLLIFGIITNSLFSIVCNNSSYILNSITLAIFIFILSYILWKMRLWAGGDVKLLTAIAASIPIEPDLFKFQFLDLQFPLIPLYPFPLTLIFNSILISFPFLILLLLKNNYKSYLKKNIFKYKEFNEFHNIIIRIKSRRKTIFKNIILSIFFSSIIIVITRTYLNIYYSLYFLSFSIIFSLISSFLFKSLIKTFKNFIKKGSSKEINILNLNDGMIINNLNITIDKKFNKNFNKIIDDYDSNKSNINIKKINNEKQLEYILNSSTAAGLTLQDITFIQKLFNMDFIPEKIPIKVGVPFAPSIAIALIISIFIGDLCLLFINILNNLFNYLHFF